MGRREEEGVVGRRGEEEGVVGRREEEGVMRREE